MPGCDTVKIAMLHDPVPFLLSRATELLEEQFKTLPVFVPAAESASDPAA
jgi:hypothetical protein